MMRQRDLASGLARPLPPPTSADRGRRVDERRTIRAASPILDRAGSGPVSDCSAAAPLTPRPPTLGGSSPGRAARASISRFPAAPASTGSCPPAAATFEGARFAMSLAAHIRPGRALRPSGTRRYGCGIRHRGSSVCARKGGRRPRAGLSSPHERSHREPAPPPQRSPRGNTNARPVVCVRLQLSSPARAANRLEDRAGQSKLAGRTRSARQASAGICPVAGEDAQRDGQVEPARFLGQVGGREG